MFFHVQPRFAACVRQFCSASLVYFRPRGGTLEAVTYRNYPTMSNPHLLWKSLLTSYPPGEVEVFEREAAQGDGSLLGSKVREAAVAVESRGFGGISKRSGKPGRVNACGFAASFAIARDSPGRVLQFEPFSDSALESVPGFSASIEAPRLIPASQLPREPPRLRLSMFALPGEVN